MKFHYAGKYDGDETKLPQREHEPGAVMFKEPQSAKTLSLIANVGALVLLVILGIPFIKVAGPYIIGNRWGIGTGALICLLCLVPHELLHAICFKKDVYMYQYLSKGMLFVVGPEDMSKSRFIFMSLLPNLVFGFIPFILYFFMPQHIVLGAFGLASITCGFGDYVNVFNALTQMPKGSRTYLHGFHSYWYKP